MEQIALGFVETALGTEEQMIVGEPRSIDNLLVDQHGIDDAAHLDQLLPVPAVAGKA